MIVYFWRCVLTQSRCLLWGYFGNFNLPGINYLNSELLITTSHPQPPQSSSIIFIGIENSLKKLIVNWILLPEGKIYFIAICETRKEGIVYLQKSYYRCEKWWQNFTLPVLRHVNFAIFRLYLTLSFLRHNDDRFKIKHNYNIKRKIPRDTKWLKLEKEMTR